MKADPTNILVSMLLPIGDSLFTSPSVHALRQTYPLAHITVMAYPNNAGVVAANPDIDQVWVWPTRDNPLGVRRIARLVRRLHDEHFDLLVQFSTYNFWLNYMTSHPPHAAIQLPRFWWIAPGAGREWRKSHSVEHYSMVVRDLGIPILDWRLRMQPTPADELAAQELLASHGIGPDEKLLGIHLGGEGLWGRKRWPVERFAIVADGLHARLGERPVVFGGRDDLPLAQKMCELTTSPVMNLAGQTTLGQTAALARRCELFIGNDSSPLHIAAAMGTPVIGLYGVTDPASYRPWVPGGRPGIDFAVVQPKSGCKACYPLLGGTTMPQVYACMTCNAMGHITPKQVLDTALNMLAARRAEQAVGYPKAVTPAY